jgi:anaerobic selenocysteine-containing dehydrogenase
MSETRLAYRTCPLCEATCGLEITLGPDGVEGIRGDAADVLSHGYICPKGASLGGLHDDPDRLRQPHVRRPDGSHEAVSWEEAFAEVERLLVPILEAHGPDAIGAYVGNPMGHSLAGSLYLRGFHKTLGTRSLYTVGTVDQQPKSLASGLLYGSQFTVGIPDVDRTSHLLVLGANPVVSNGSLIAAPDMRGRLRAIRSRGGKVVVVDPVRTRTAREADEHHFIRPGTDALLLAAMAHTLFEEELVRLGELDAHVSGLTEVRAFVAAFPPERVAGACGIEATQIRRLARELAAAESAAVYGRIGTTLQAFGTAASWLVDVLNVLTGNLDRPGGVMFTTPAAGGPTFIGEPGRGSGVSTGRWHTRVRGLPEVLGELPLACLAEEIDTPGDGRLRALVTFSGNPALSNPNGQRLAVALGRLEALVCIDFYLNETTRQAHVILPPPSPLERAHYDLAVYPTAVRNVANYSPPALPLPADARDEWEIVLALTAIVGRLGAAADLEALDRQVALDALRRRCADPHSSIAGRDADELLASLEPRKGEQRLLDIYLRCGPYGDAFGTRPDGLTLAVLEETPHGIDFGPLEPRLPGVLRTPSGTIELGHPLFLGEGDRLSGLVDAELPDLLLVGRREQRSLNSWMHNLPKLTGGKGRCTARLHSSEVSRLGLEDGGDAILSSRVGAITITIEVSDDLMPGVVSVPHGWGHDAAGAQLRVAATQAGINSNLLSDEQVVDAPSGTTVLNGIPVTLTPA